MGIAFPMDYWRLNRLKRQLRELDKSIRRAASRPPEAINEQTVRRVARFVRQQRGIRRRSRKISARIC